MIDLTEIKVGLEGVQGGPWKLDSFACYIWAPSEKGGDFPLMDDPGENGRVVEMRGWGYYTGLGHGALGLHPDEAKKRQRLTGEHVARLDPQTVAAWIAETEALRAQVETLTKERDSAREYGAQARIRENAAEDARITAIDSLQSKLLTARKALESFALAAADLPEHISDLCPVVLTTDAEDNPADFVHIGDFRRASQALKDTM